MSFCVVFLLMQLDRLAMRGAAQHIHKILYIPYLWMVCIDVCFQPLTVQRCGRAAFFPTTRNHIETDIRACGQVLSFEKLPLSYQFMRQAHRRLHETTTMTLFQFRCAFFFVCIFFSLPPSLAAFPFTTLYSCIFSSWAQNSVLQYTI